MHKKILIIGGTRYFGRLLVAGLLDAGHHVTLATRGRSPDTFGDRVTRIHVDRRDATAMQQAFAQADYDLIYDQVCYTPHDAAIASAVFAGKTARYVMASTIEVYRDRVGSTDQAFAESAIDLAQEPIGPLMQWQDPDWAAQHYGLGKRQTEAYFHQQGRLPIVTVRIGHVLAGSGDFTGRLARHIERVVTGAPMPDSAGWGLSSFISAAHIARFLQWLGSIDALGAFNAADHTPFSARMLEAQIARHCAPALIPAVPSESLGDIPFDYPAPFVMATTRAETLGHTFGDTADWLDSVIQAQRQAYHAQAVGEGRA